MEARHWQSAHKVNDRLIDLLMRNQEGGTSLWKARSAVVRHSQSVWRVTMETNPGLCTGVGSAMEGGRGRAGTKLFQDFQVLSRIWTHPWCLQLDYISKENKVRYPDRPPSPLKAEGGRSFPCAHHISEV